MNVLFIGDVIGQKALEKLSQALPSLKKEEDISLTVINGENSADGNGITPFSANALFDAGADVVTSGNHAFKRKEADEIYERRKELIRPYNYGEDCPGKGWRVLDFGSFRVAVVNLMGNAYMPPCDNPFKAADEVLNSPDLMDVKNIIVDFHAEATAEKKAMGYYIGKRVSAIIGTHTHVQTCDERILYGRAAYITDVGMTGCVNSVIGAEKKSAILKFTSYYPVKFRIAEGDCELNAVVITIDEKSGKAVSIKRIIRKI